MELLERFREFVAIKRIKNETLAEIFGVTIRGVSNIKCGKNALDTAKIQALLQYYPELSAEWLLRGKGDMVTTNNVGTNVQMNSNNINADNTLDHILSMLDDAHQQIERLTRIIDNLTSK